MLLTIIEAFIVLQALLFVMKSSIDIFLHKEIVWNEQWDIAQDINLVYFIVKFSLVLFEGFSDKI